MNAESQGERRRLRIVCIDEHPLFADAYGHIFSASGHEAVSFHDGQLAWEYLASDLAAVDLVVLDQPLPRLDGVSLVALLRLGGFRGRVIVHAHDVTEEQRGRFQDLAVDFILTKGFQSKDLFSLVEMMAQV
ncbi:MAG: response regulator [Nibricoccus sp.]